MNQKKKIASKLNEMDNQKHVVMTSDKYKEMGDELDDDTVVKIVDENMGDDELKNAIAALQSQLPQVLSNYPPAMIEIINEKLYWAVMDGYDEFRRANGGSLGENEEAGTENVNVPKLKADVQKFMDRLNLGQFKGVIAKIDTPLEKAELIAAFSERIGVPRAKLPVMIQQLKALGAGDGQPVENTRPRMKKSDLVEHVLKNKR